MCATYESDDENCELILAYRGTDNTDPADLITDGGVVSVLTSPVSDDIIRTLIYREMVRKIWGNAAVATAAKGTLAGQLGGRIVNAMKYYQEQAKLFEFAQYDRITVVGHSLEGVIAASVSYWAVQEFTNHSIYCHTFNSAPGAKYT